MDGQSLQSTLRRGWYFGTEAFREELLEKLGGDEATMQERRRRGYSGAQTRDHGEREARRILAEAGSVFGIAGEEWASLKKGDWRKGVVAALIRERALVDNGWLAENLHMGARNAVSRTIRQGREHARTHRAARKLTKQLTDHVRKF